MPKQFNPKDKYFYKAKEKGYMARSVFKLEEIQQKFKILHKHDLILDLGAAPGSFLQFTSKIIGDHGHVLGVDLQEIKDLKLSNVQTKICDIYDDNSMEKIINQFLEQINYTENDRKKYSKFNTIVSDLAPKTSGIKDVDQWKSVELSQQVLEIAKIWLKPKGNLLIKIFQGADFDEFLKEIKKYFKKVKVNKPKAVRKSSKEVYLVCIEKK